MKKYTSILFILFCFFCTTEEGIAQCFPGKIVTSAFATGGDGEYLDKIFWLTWGSSSNEHPIYGYHDQPLNINGTANKSYGSIPLGDGRFMCVEATIIKSERQLNSYLPGSSSNDYLDQLYNIGGTGGANKLVSGIINRHENRTGKFTLRVKAFIKDDVNNSNPIRIPGLIVADAESLNTDEYIHAAGDGTWSVVEVYQNPNAGAYNISKNNNAIVSNQEIQFEKGNNNKTGAIAFLKFNEIAYDINNGFAVEVNTTLQGDVGSRTAVAFGVVVPGIDLGDAPESYGAPGHILHGLEVKGDDGIEVDGIAVNINDSGYTSAKLELGAVKFLGTTAPDADTEPMHSVDAKGDDNSGPLSEAGIITEEDAWPDILKRFSYKANYMPGNTISAEIEFNNGEVGDYIYGWIDFDLNGEFDDNDEMASKIIEGEDITNGSVILEWTVPATRVPYNTYVRLRYFDSSVDEPDRTATSIVNYGEVEDHRMYILTPARINPMLPSKPKLNTN